jgi:hypothetical protein
VEGKRIDRAKKTKTEERTVSWDPGCRRRIAFGDGISRLDD